MKSKEKTTTLAKLRKERNITQKDLGKMLGVSANAVCQWEKGKRNPPLATARTISVIFNMPIEYIQFASK